jgi:hypothetical protein
MQRISTVGGKPVVLATASHTFGEAGSATLRLKLTAAGRKAIRRAKKLTVTIVTRFSPLSGSPVTDTQRLTIRAKPREARWSSRRTTAAQTHATRQRLFTYGYGFTASTETLVTP